MSDLKNWADNAELNVESSPNGWPEGMPPSAVNNSAREMMAALRRSYVRQPWFAPGGTIVRASTSQITIADDAKVTNYSNYYTVGARVRVETTGGDYVLGRIVNSQYEAPTSTVTFELDAEADLPSVITDVYVGLSPEDVSGITGPNLLGCIIGFSEESDKIGAGLLFANGQAFSPTLYPDLAQLYYQGDDEDDYPIYKYGRELHGDVYWPLRPDVRGYFPRFADDRAVPGENEEETRLDPDAPRVVGTTQEESIPGHAHKLKVQTAIGGGYAAQSGYISAGTYAASADRGIWANSTNSENAVSITSYGGVGDANEVRPENIALVGVIVAYSGVITSGLADVSELEEYCTAERERAERFANLASEAATSAEREASSAHESALSASSSAENAGRDARDASDYALAASSSAALARAWATSDNVVEDDQYGAYYYSSQALGYKNAAETASGTAQDWASKTSGTVDGTNYSSKYYAGQAAASASEAADIVASIGPVMRYRGSVASYANLPTTGNVVGDVWNTADTGKNYAYTTSGTWDDFGGAITISIAACTDVNLTSLAGGEVLIYNSSTQKWENGKISETYKGVYDSTKTYLRGDIVFDGTTEMYIAWKDVPVNTGPSQYNYWKAISNDKLVGYLEKSDNVEYPVGFTNTGISGDGYAGNMNFTLTNTPTINASTGALTATILKTTTQAQGDNSTNAATTEYVDTAVAGTAHALTDVATAGDNITFTTSTIDDYTVAGTDVTVTSGIASGFNSSSYLYKGISVYNAAITGSFTFQTKFKLSATGSADYENVFFCVRSNPYASGSDVFTFNISRINRIRFNGYDVDGTTISSNVDYWLRVVYNGSAISIQLSTDGTNFTELKTEAWSFSSSIANNMFIGISDKNSGTYFNGSIDLTETWFKDGDGNVIWVASSLSGLQHINAVLPSTTVTLASANWSSNTQTVTVSGMTSSKVVWISPAPTSASDYASGGVLCTAQGTNSLTFTCDTTPTNDISVNVVYA